MNSLKSFIAVLSAALLLALFVCEKSEAPAENPTISQRQKPELVIQIGHYEGWLNEVVFSPDGKILAAGDFLFLKLWDVKTGRLIRDIPTGLGNQTKAFGFSPDGKMIAGLAVDSDPEPWHIGVWDVVSGKVIQILDRSKEEQNTYNLSFSPDGKKLMSQIQGPGSGDVLKIWETGSWRLIKTLNVEFGSYSFRPGGWILGVTEGNYRKVELSNLSEGRIIQTFKGHENGDMCFALSADGKILASSGCDAAHTTCCAEESCDKYSLHLWDISTGKLMRTLNSGHWAYAHDSFLLFRPDGKVLAVCGYGAVELWNVNTGQLIRKIKARDDAFAFSPDGKMLGSVTGIWDAQTGQRIRSFEINKDGLSGSSIVSPNGNILAVSESNSIRLWDIKKGKNIRTIENPGKFVPESFFSGSRILTTVNYEPGMNARLWSINDGSLIGSFKGSKFSRISMSSDGKKIAIVGCKQLGPSDTCEKWRIRILDAKTSHIIHLLSEQTEDILSAELSPDGKILVSNDWSKKIKFWDVSTGKLVRSIDGYSRSSDPFCFSPRGRFLFFKGEEGALLWDFKEDAPITLSINQYFGPVCFDPDEKFLAVMGIDKIHIWDLNSFKLVRTIEVNSHSGESLAFSEDGKILVSGGENRSVKFWSASDGKLLCSLWLLGDKDWLFLTESGEFEATLGAKKYIGWTVGLRSYPPEKFWNHYYHRGLYGQVINQIYKK